MKGLVEKQMYPKTVANCINIGVVEFFRGGKGVVPREIPSDLPWGGQTCQMPYMYFSDGATAQNRRISLCYFSVCALVAF